MPFSSSRQSRLPRQACHAILRITVSSWLWDVPLGGGWWTQCVHNSEASQFSPAVKCCLLSDCMGICTLVIDSSSENRG